MAASDDLKEAAGCLATVFPSFIAKELAGLTDQVATAIQGFTDPLAAIGDLSVDKLVSDVVSLSEGNIYSNLGGVAAGLGAQYAKREATEMLGAMAEEYPSVTKRVHKIRNMASTLSTNVTTMMSLYKDMPYAAAQRMCKTIIELDEAKVENLACLKKHIIQLVNCVLLLAEAADEIKDSTFADLELVAAQLIKVQDELTRSQRQVGTEVVFDTRAFERAREGMTVVDGLLTPDKDGTTVLDLVDIGIFGSVAGAASTKSNKMLTLLVVPSLTHLIEVEIQSVVSQVQVINYLVGKLGQVIQNFREVGQSNRVKEQRARAIAEIKQRLFDLATRIDLARSRGSLRAASAEMLLWSARVKTIMATMDQVGELTLQEGSLEGESKAAQLEAAFQSVLADLQAITNESTVAGIENPLALRDKVLSLTKATRRIMSDLETGKTSANKIKTLHLLASNVAQAQVNAIERSSTVAQQQMTICRNFAAIELEFGPRFDQMLDSLRQFGLDRGVDMIASGSFREFLDSDASSLSYLGSVIGCLTKAIKGTDDDQTRQQIDKIRQQLIGQQTNQDIAAADSADGGLARLLGKLKSNIATIQKNGETVKSIVTELKRLVDVAGDSLDESFEGLQAFGELLGNVDQLAVGAGGRLAAGLEEFSEHPNGGVVLCDPL